MKFINIPHQVIYILSELNIKGYEAYIVGGCVRDKLLYKDPNDYDICTSATPEEVIKTFPCENIIPTGLQHGTVTIVMNDKSYEVTTYRIDGKYSDNRKPDNVEFTTDIYEDLSRRDFTINAIAYDWFNCSYIDPFNGISDINNKIIRCVGNPYDRFNEDGLRILRAIRFASQLGFDIEEETERAIHENKHLLHHISRERINSELCKILMSKKCGNNVLRNYVDVLCEVIPEIMPMVGFKQNNIHHKHDVWEHTLHCMECEPSNGIDIIVRLAVLLHDIGKPCCYTEDENKTGHFYGHAKISSEIADNILKRLKFSNEIRENVVELISCHDAQLLPSKKIVKRLLNKLGKEQLERLLALRRCDITGQNINSPYFADKLDSINGIYSILDSVINENECFTLKNLAINGKDLIEYGIPQGKLIGEILDTLLIMVIDNEIDNDKEKLLSMVHLLIKNNK